MVFIFFLFYAILISLFISLFLFFIIYIWNISD